MVMLYVLTDCNLMEEFSKASVMLGLSDQLLIRNCLNPPGSVMKSVRGISSSVILSAGSEQCYTCTNISPVTYVHVNMCAFLS